MSPTRAPQPLAGLPRRTYTTDGGAAFDMPVVPAPPAGDKLTVACARRSCARSWSLSHEA